MLLADSLQSCIGREPFAGDHQQCCQIDASILIWLDIKPFLITKTEIQHAHHSIRKMCSHINTQTTPSGPPWTTHSLHLISLVICLWRLLGSGDWFRLHRCGYWCQCKSGVGGWVTCWVWMGMLVQLWRLEFKLDGMDSGSWCHCLPLANGICH